MPVLGFFATEPLDLEMILNNWALVANLSLVGLLLELVTRLGIRPAVMAATHPESMFA